jgi:hypothetical protein
MSTRKSLYLKFYFLNAMVIDCTKDNLRIIKAVHGVRTKWHPIFEIHAVINVIRLAKKIPIRLYSGVYIVHSWYQRCTNRDQWGLQ